MEITPNPAVPEESTTVTAPVENGQIEEVVDTPEVETPPVETEEVPEGLSEPQVSNWKALRMARDDFKSQLEARNQEYEQIMQRIAPIEPVLDELHSLADALVPEADPLNPDAALIREQISRISPLADRYLAGSYLEQHGDWLISQVSQGRFNSMQELQQFSANGGVQQTPANGQPVQQGYDRLSSQLELLDPDLKEMVESQMKEAARVKELEERLNKFESTDKQRMTEAQQQAHQGRAMEFQTQRASYIDQLLKQAKVEPFNPDGTPNHLYNDVKRIVGWDMWTDQKVQNAIVSGGESYAQGLVVDAQRKQQFIEQEANKYFKAAYDRYLKPTNESRLAEQQRVLAQSQARNGDVSGSSIPPTPPNKGKVEYDSDPIRRRAQLQSTVGAIFGKKQL